MSPRVFHPWLVTALQITAYGFVGGSVYGLIGWAAWSYIASN